MTLVVGHIHLHYRDHQGACGACQYGQWPAPGVKTTLLAVLPEALQRRGSKRSRLFVSHKALLLQRANETCVKQANDLSNQKRCCKHQRTKLAWRLLVGVCTHSVVILCR